MHLTFFQNLALYIYAAGTGAIVAFGIALVYIARLPHLRKKYLRRNKEHFKNNIGFIVLGIIVLIIGFLFFFLGGAFYFKVVGYTVVFIVSLFCIATSIIYRVIKLKKERADKQDI